MSEINILLEIPTYSDILNHIMKAKKKKKCDICGKDYSRKDALIRHKKNHEKISNKRAINPEETPSQKN